MPRSIRLLHQLLRDEEGAALLEYGILVLLVAVVCIAAVKTFGSKTGNAYTTANTAIP